MAAYTGHYLILQFLRWKENIIIKLENKLIILIMIKCTKAHFENYRSENSNLCIRININKTSFLILTISQKIRLF